MLSARVHAARRTALSGLEDRPAVELYVRARWPEMVSFALEDSVRAEIVDQIIAENPGYIFEFPVGGIEELKADEVIRSFAAREANRQADTGAGGGGSSTGGGTSTGGRKTTGRGASTGSGTSTGADTSTGGEGLARRDQDKNPAANALPAWLLPVAAGVAIGLIAIYATRRRR